MGGTIEERRNHVTSQSLAAIHVFYSLVVPAQYGCRRPPLMQKSTCPMRPPSPYRPALVCTTCTAFAWPLSSRLPALINGRAGSRPMIFSNRKLRKLARFPHMCAPRECPTQVVRSMRSPELRKKIRLWATQLATGFKLCTAAT